MALGAADAAHLSWTRGNEDGAPLLRSPLVDELGPRKDEIATAGARSDPAPRSTRAPSTRRPRAWCSRCAAIARSRLSARDAEAAALLPAIAQHDPPRLGRLEHLVAVERQRHRFFVGDVEAHGYVGALRDAGAAGARSPPPSCRGGARMPLSATSVEAYAACPFKFFLRSVLRVGELEEVDDEIDHRTLGRLYHDVLERLFSRLGAEGRFPLRRRRRR